ncbi:helix-turn-helix domain-containing protein [Streptomyces cyaneofuscatus]|uniref:helix-turn-helix domain-containing protein n=1 Tax=Streptomyces griseus group TaxID=629295 RepID=UPI003443470F
MGRRESPVDCSAPHRGRLAEELRQCRHRAGLTYAELAERTGVSAATLKRAASGKTVARRDTVETAVTTCGGSRDTVRAVVELWRCARIEERGRVKVMRAPRPELISDEGDLSKALELLYEQAGAPTLRELQRRSGDPRALPVSSAARIVKRVALPADLAQLKAFLTGCELPLDRHVVWVNAWNKITSRRTAKSATSTTHQPASPQRGNVKDLLRWSPYLPKGWTSKKYPCRDEKMDEAFWEPFHVALLRSLDESATLRLRREADRNGLSDVIIHGKDGRFMLLEWKQSPGGSPRSSGVGIAPDPPTGGRPGTPRRQLTASR